MLGVTNPDILNDSPLAEMLIKNLYYGGANPLVDPNFLQ